MKTFQNHNYEAGSNGPENSLTPPPPLGGGGVVSPFSFQGLSEHR
jgi:hypothetical protein